MYRIENIGLDFGIYSSIKKFGKLVLKKIFSIKPPFEYDYIILFIACQMIEYYILEGFL
jgi:hypothetical protein